MDDTLSVSVIQSIAHLGENGDYVLKPEPSRLNQSLQDFSLHIFHDEVERGVGFSKIVDPDDIAVSEAGHGPCLPLESLNEGFIRAGIDDKDLNRHQAVKPRMAGLVVGAHPAVAYVGQYLEMREESLDFLDTGRLVVSTKGGEPSLGWRFVQTWIGHGRNG